MIADQLLDNKVIQRSLASLYALTGTTKHDVASQSYSSSSPEITALKKLLVEECARLRCSADASFTKAKYVLRALGLHLLFHEINTFVESDNAEMIACLFTQAEAFIEHHRQDEALTTPGVAAVIAGLQKNLRVKSHTFHQLPCTPTTTIKRVEVIRKYLTPSSRILCLGDDDFVSVALALTVPNEITVLDIDPQIITMIEQVSKEQRLRLHCRRADIRKSLPEDLYASFDIVVTDPIYSVKEMLLFLSVAEACLRKSPTSYLLSCCSRSMAGAAWPAVEAWAASRGLVIHEFLTGFNEYPKPARIQRMLTIGERLFFRSAVTKACVSLPFLYSDLAVFRFDRSLIEYRRGNNL